MGTTYSLDVYDTAGNRQYELSDFRGGLAYTKRVNSPGILQFITDGSLDIVSNIQDKWEIDVWRKPEGGTKTRDFVGIYRYGDQRQTKDTYMFRAICPGVMSKLGWRTVAYYAGTDNRSKFTSAKAETVMKTLVDYNACANATTGNSRLRNGAITGITIQADGANGNTVNWYCSYANLLESLQKLARIAGGDFDLTKTSPTAWRFDWFTGQLGTDKSATVIFEVGRGNMGNVIFVDSKTDEKTVAIVGGQGELELRDTEIVTGDNFSTSNDLEMFVNATDIVYGDTAGLANRGSENLDTVKAREEFVFDAIESQNTRYGIEYVLGDLVTTVNPFTSASLTQKITAVTVTLDANGTETILPEFSIV